MLIAFYPLALLMARVIEQPFFYKGVILIAYIVIILKPLIDAAIVENVSVIVPMEP